MKKLIYTSVILLAFLSLSTTAFARTNVEIQNDIDNLNMQALSLKREIQSKTSLTPEEKKNFKFRASSIKVRIVQLRLEIPHSKITNPVSGVPVLSSLSQTSGYIGQNITIYGTFPTTGNKVRVKTSTGSFLIPITFENGSAIQFTIPSSLEGKGAVSIAVENANPFSGQSSLPFSIIATPQTNSVPTPIAVDLIINNQDGVLSVEKGSSLVLKWSSTGAVSCNGSWGTSQMSGTQALTANESTTYTITCSNPQKEVRHVVTVNVTASPVIPPTTNPAISAVIPTSANAGDTITLSGSNFTASQNTVYIKTQSRTSGVQPIYQTTNSIKFILPVWAIGPTQFAVENGNLDMSPYRDFSVTSAPNPIPNPSTAP